MALETPITYWVFSHKNQLHPQMTDFSWPKSFGIDLFDIETKIVWDNRTFIGRGAADSLRLAIEVSCAEALERLACFYHGRPSVGVAAHSIKGFAEENALLEAKERYSLGLYRNGALRPVEMDQDLITHKYQLPLGTRVTRFYLSSTEEASCLSIFQLDTQYFMGLSMAESQEKAIFKADCEALRNLSAYYLNKESFQQQLSNNSDMWCCDNRLISQILEGESKVNTSLEDQRWTTQVLSLPKSSIFDSAPLHIVAATKEDLLR